MPSFSPNFPNKQFFSDQGEPLDGGLLYVYDSGEPGTNGITYQDVDLLIPNTNPIVLDSAGRCVIYVPEDPDLYFVLTDSTGTQIWAQDAVQPGEVTEMATVSKTLTNAEIKALPTTGITLLAAQGANTLIAWSEAHLFTSFAAGAYTNINTTYSVIQLAINGIGQSLSIVKDSTTTPALTNLTRLLGAAARHVRVSPYIEAAGGGGEQYIIPCTADGTVGIDTTASLLNQALTIYADNNGSGNYTGGNAANTLTVVVTYQILTVS